MMTHQTYQSVTVVLPENVVVRREMPGHVVPSLHADRWHNTTFGVLAHTQDSLAQPGWATRFASAGWLGAYWSLSSERWTALNCA